MRTVDIAQATPELIHELLDAIETGREAEIIITRDGHPVARLLSAVPAKSKEPIILGILAGKVKLPEGWEEDFKAQRKEIEQAIYDSGLEESGEQTYILDPNKIKIAE